MYFATRVYSENKRERKSEKIEVYVRVISGVLETLRKLPMSLQAFLSTRRSNYFP